MMKLLLAISMIAIAMHSVDNAALILEGFAKVNGWTFYKIKVKGAMTNFNVNKACKGNNLSTPCYAGAWDTFNSDECDVVFPDTVTEDSDTMQYLSVMLCNHRKPHECEKLADTFVYKDNWAGDSACGAVPDEKYCSYGESSYNRWALCATPDDLARTADTDDTTKPADEGAGAVDTDGTTTPADDGASAVDTGDTTIPADGN